MGEGDDVVAGRLRVLLGESLVACVVSGDVAYVAVSGPDGLVIPRFFRCTGAGAAGSVDVFEVALEDAPGPGEWPADVIGRLSAPLNLLGDAPEGR